MKKYIKSADAPSTSYKIGHALPMRYEVDAENALFDFKKYGRYEMTICGDDLVVKESTGYYTVVMDVYSGEDILNMGAEEDFRIGEMLEEGMSEFEILLDYITTESIDADDFNVYFSVNRKEIEGLSNLIQFEAKRCGW